jgi:hypothetical protein
MPAGRNATSSKHTIGCVLLRDVADAFDFARARL